MTSEALDRTRPDSLSIGGRLAGSSQKRRCAHVSANGAGCLANALRDSEYCFYHDPRPEIVAKRLKAAAKGTKNSKRMDGLSSWSSRSISTMEELKTALSDLFNAGMSGEISTQRLAALSSVANALRAVIEGSDLEKRISELEERMKPKEAVR